MRTKLVVGNWKMNSGIEETKNFYENLIENSSLQNINHLMQVCICPPFTSLNTASQLLQNSTIALGAQDVSVNENGAFTGEVSISMLKELNCQFVIVGHSERRMYFKETDSLINKKAIKILEHKLTPIICVGETLEQREADETKEVIKEQINGVIENMSKEDLLKIVIAYEPVWAIGTGKVATPEEAAAVCGTIREAISAEFGAELAAATRILYGGSVKAANVAGFLRSTEVDGVLVGGASLDAEEFSGIARFQKHIAL